MARTRFGIRGMGLPLVGLLVVGILAGPPPKAAAFDDYGLGCGNKTKADIVFNTDPRWSQTITGGDEGGISLRTAVEKGRSDWTTYNIRTWNGHYALGGGGSDFTMIPATNNNLNGAVARTSCSAKTIRFNENNLQKYLNGTIRLRGVSAHEWGHVWGLGHAGRYDSHGGGPPSMSTCWTFDYVDLAGIAQDDSAGIQYQINKSGSYGAATANPSFEEGTRWWGMQSVGSYQIRSGGVDGSPRYLRIYGSSYYTAIYSTARLTDYFWDGDQVGAKIKARANYKKITSAATGYVLVQAKWKNVDYSGTNAKDIVCQIRDDINDPTQHSGPWTVISKYCYPGSSWDYCTTGIGTVHEYDSRGWRAEGIDVRVAVYNRMKLNGSYLGVDLDRVRALVISS